MPVDPAENARHDYFNLFALPAVIYTSLQFIYHGSIEYLWVYVMVMSVYIFVDTIWVLVIPKCVASPITISLHHVVVLVGLVTLLYLEATVARRCGCGGLIEINTFFLIARRNFRDVTVLNVIFYITWIPIRCIMGPWLSYTLLQDILNFDDSLYSHQFIALVVMSIILLFLNLLNGQWTYDLFKKKGNKVDTKRGL